MFRDHYNLPRKIEGDKVGIEVEVEGFDLPGEIPGWEWHDDGSLRGESAEYVIPNPVTLAGAKTKVKALKKALDKCDIQDTGRAGVHVHVNIQDMEKAHIFNFITLYLVFEEVLMRYCGKDRIGNLFCLRLKDAEYLADALDQVAQTGNYNILYTDDVRYASINCKALVQYGSLEFRGMRSTIDPDVLIPWVEMLLTLKAKAKCYHQSSEIIEDISKVSPEGLAMDIFGEHFRKLDYPNLTRDVMECARDCQIFAYQTFAPERKKTEFKHEAPGMINPEWAILPDPDGPQEVRKKILTPVLRRELENRGGRERAAFINHLDMMNYKIPEELR